MKTTFIRRPSAAAAVMILALLVAAGGTATAAVRGQNGNHLISKHSLSGNRLRNNSVTGKQVKESSLGQVRKAKNATTVDGQKIVNFRKLVATGDTTHETALSLDGLTLAISCGSTGQPDVTATSSINGAFMRGTKVSGATATTMGTSVAAGGTPLDIFTTTDGLGSFILHYLTTSGTFVDVTAVVDNHNTIGEFDGCLLEGNAIVGG